MNMRSQDFRESGLEWLGRIPFDWSVRRIKDIAELRSGDAIASEQIAPAGDYPVFGGNGVRGFTPSFTHDGHYVLIGRQGALCGNVNYARGKFWATEHAVVATLLRNHDAIWFGELLRTMNLNQYSNAAAQPGLAVDRIKFIRLPVPPLSEQHRIAAYLDASCASIDAAVAAKRSQLETLDALCSSILLRAVTMGSNDRVATRPTGKAILPQLPAAWRLVRLKSVAAVRYGLGQPPAELESGVAMLRATDIDAGMIRTDNLLRVDPAELPKERKPYLKAGEIIVVRSGAYTGDSAIVPPELEGAVAGYDMVVTVTRASSRFVAYSLLSRYVLEGQLLLLTLRAAQPHLNAEELGSVLVALPPTRAEQEVIVAFLDRRLAEVRRIVTGIETQIATLTNYRKSLIHECVTGQRRITEADLNHAKAHV
jgi:type I restriction enzyme, S subunit